MEEQLDRERTISLVRLRHAEHVSVDGKPLTEHLQRVADVAYSLLRLHIYDYALFAPASEQFRMDYLWHAGQMHETLLRSGGSFDDLTHTFNLAVAATITAITPDHRLAGPIRDKRFLVELQNATLDAQILQLTDIADNIGMFQRMLVRPTPDKIDSVLPKLSQYATWLPQLSQLRRYPRFITEMSRMQKLMDRLELRCLDYLKAQTLKRKLKANVQRNRRTDGD